MPNTDTYKILPQKINKLLSSDIVTFTEGFTGLFQHDGDVQRCLHIYGMKSMSERDSTAIYTAPFARFSYK